MVKYNYEHIDMLLAAGMVVQSFRKYVDDLSYIRTNWTREYADSLNERIDKVMKNYLGVTYPADLRKATDRIIEIRPTTRRDLAFIMREIKENFSKEEADAILKYLGFDLYINDVIDHDQESLINLLFTFKSGMTRGLKRLITGQGTNPPLIDRIMEHAGIFQQANQIQKQLKQYGHQPPNKAHQELQDIYKEVMLICKIGAVFYQEEPDKRDFFIFAKVVHSINAGSSPQEGERSRDE
ncbi:MAG: hypothetical protein ACQER7_03855 [Bacteroidota bacterium]